jgi:subtilisin family serine protease
MVIRFLYDINIRQSPVDLDLPPVGVFYADTEWWVEPGTVRGTSIGNNDLWYTNGKGLFVWSGAAEVIKGAPQDPIPFDSYQFEFAPLTGHPINWDRIYFDEKHMNWGIDHYQILKEYWQKRGLTGKGVKVAILDTGIFFDHPDLKPAVKGFKNLCTEAWGQNHDLDGSGTRSAGLIAAQGRAHVFGIAPEADLYVAKIMQHFYEPRADRLIEGIRWALQQQVDIILTSVDLTSDRITRAERDQLEHLIDSMKTLEVLFISSAGDAVKNEQEDRYPAAFPTCLSVGAFDQRQLHMETSAKSPQLDLLAPGEDLLTTGLNHNVDHFGGTAAAAAFTAGLAALCYQLLKERGIALSMSEWSDLFNKSATSSPDQDQTAYGSGLLNPLALLQQLDQIPIP